MKRVYYSGFIPVNPYDKRLPALDKAPLVRENRLKTNHTKHPFGPKHRKESSL